MAVTVILPGMLRRLYAIPTSRVLLPETPPTLDGVIDILHGRYPGMRDRLCAPDGMLREYINIFVDRRERGRNPAAITILDGAEIHVVPSIAGGGTMPGFPR